MLQTKNRIILMDDQALLPQRQTIYSIGYDLHSNSSAIIKPGHTIKISTGCRLELTKDDQNGKVYYAEIKGRSGLFSNGIVVAPGLIDPDYNQSLVIIITNTTNSDFKIEKGDRIAQLVIYQYNLHETTLYDSNNHAIPVKKNNRVSGFGSTGK